MKTCPSCRTQYSDDTLFFCLQDGTPLVGSEAENPTVALGETETFVRRVGGEHVDVPADDSDHAVWRQSVATQVAEPRMGKKSSTTSIAVAVTALGMLFLFG